MKRHPFDAVSLVFGLLFAGIGALFLAGVTDVPDLIARFWPGALVLLGLAMLFSTRRTEGVSAAPLRPASTPPPVPPVSPTPPPPVASPPEPPAPATPVGPEADTTVQDKTE